VRRDLRIGAALLLLGICLVAPFAAGHVRWYTDSLYYESQKLEAMGDSQPEALREVFTSELARPLAGRLPSAARRAEYASFYRRRWAVPALAAALTWLWGVDALRNASLIGWALLPALLFLLLRRRFAARPSVVAACAASVLPPLLMWAPAPLVDSWGLSMLVAGLLLAFLAQADLRWLPAFAVVALVGSFTRDIGLVLVVAVGWLAVRERSRRAALVGVVGVLASAPAPLIFAAPLKQNLTYLVNGFNLPSGNVGWGWIASRYPGAVADTLVSDLGYPFRVALPYELLALAFAIPALAGLWLLVRAERSPFLTTIRAAAVAGVATVLLSPNYTGLRLELVFVPAIATGFALLAERIWRAQSPSSYSTHSERSVGSES
jgi:hypothetical protein